MLLTHTIIRNNIIHHQHIDENKYFRFKIGEGSKCPRCGLSFIIEDRF